MSGALEVKKGGRVPPFCYRHSRAQSFGMPEIGKLLVVFGAIAMLVGALIWAGFGNWVGRLPGDIRVERGSSGFYFPIVTCIIISIVLTVLMSLFRR